MKRHIILIFFILIGVPFACFPYHNAEAKEVVVVLRGNVVPFLQVKEGFSKTCNCSIKTINLESSNDILGQIRRDKPAAVHAIGSDALKEVSALRDVPIIYSMILPDSAFVSQKRANISGVDLLLSPKKYIHHMKEVLNARVIGVIYSEEQLGWFMDEAVATAAEMSVELILRPVHDLADLSRIVSSIFPEIDVLWMLPDFTLGNKDVFDAVMAESIEHRKPVFSFARKYVGKGAVAGAEIIPFEIGMQVGEMSRDILFKGRLSGGKVHSRNYRLYIDRGIAKKYGLKIEGKMPGFVEFVE